ncbi:hypothetical protein [Pontibacter fetidus]|uniref:Uncharacterized protein n=1 Tax=Pontibacter fetidus TaxID=2700082 RepID=A0A6B2H3M3_9BACT|nr:hypothetical protein [Pontibacter fetidus]NDK56953.1 hypothetical protein [Pontibacter fetidus]
MKKSVLLVAFVTILVISYTSAMAQVATTGSSLALKLAQGVHTPSGAAMLTSGGIVATAAAKAQVAVLPIFAQSAQDAAISTATPFSVEVTTAAETTMAEELNTFIAQERALKQRSWFRKNK